MCIYDFTNNTIISGLLYHPFYVGICNTKISNNTHKKFWKKISLECLLCICRTSKIKDYRPFPLCMCVCQISVDAQQNCLV